MSKEILGGEPWAHNVADEHVLNGITDAVMMNVHETLADINVDTLDAVYALLRELDRNIFIAGRRITSSIADHLHKYLQVLRPDTQLIGNVKKQLASQHDGHQEGRYSFCIRHVDVLSCPIVVALLLLNEVIIFQMQNILGDLAKERWESLESVFKSGKYFTK